MAQLVERPPSTQDVAGSSPARGSSFFLLRKKELSSGVVVYLALSLRMSLHVISWYGCGCLWWFNYPGPLLNTKIGYPVHRGETPFALHKL